MDGLKDGITQDAKKDLVVVVRKGDKLKDQLYLLNLFQVIIKFPTKPVGPVYQHKRVDILLG